MFDAAALREEWGVGPDQVVDFQALVGDKVDNVPGVPGIGPKTAQQLLETYGTLDNLLEHAAEVPGAKGKKLVECREIALLSRQLVRLDSQVPIVPDWDASRVGGMDHDALAELFAEFGFRTFARARGQASSRRRRAAVDGRATPNYQLVDTPAKLAELVAQLAEQTLISVDTETTHVSPRCAEIVGYSFAFKPGEAYYVPVRGPAGDACSIPTKRSNALRPVLENPAIRKLGQNLKYDMIVLRNVGVRLAGVAFDTMIASYLLDAGGRSHNLDDLAQKYLNHTTIKIDQLIGKGKDQKRMDEVPVAQVGDVRRRGRRHPAAHAPDSRSSGWPKWSSPSSTKRVEVPLIEVLADMEFTGVRVDPAAARRAERPLRRAARRSWNKKSKSWPAIRSTSARPSSSPGAVPGARPAGRQENQDRPKHRRRRAGATGRIAPAAGQDRRVPPVLEAQEHVRRRAADDDPSRNRPRPHVVQPGRGRHGPAQLQRPQPAKHSDPHRGRPRNSLGVRRRASRAGSCWPPTTRRSSCASSPTIRTTPRCAPRSTATKTSTRSSPARSSACRWTK